MRVVPTASFGVAQQSYATTGHAGASQPFVVRISHVYFGGVKRKVMTYNAENFYRLKNGKWQKTDEGTQALADVILKQTPDIVCLQEAGDVDMMREFNTKYLNGLYPNVYGSPVKNQRGVQNVVYFTQKGIQLESIKSHLQDICPPKGPTAFDLTTAIMDCGKRDILEAKFKTDTGYEFTLMNAHLKSMRGGEQLTAPKRMNDARVIAKIIDALIKKDPNAHIMLVGDLNFLHKSPYGKPVYEAVSLTDDTNPDNDMTETILKDGKDRPTHHGGRTYGNQKLDYMFVSKAMLKQVTRAYVTGEFTKDPWAKASDHLPMVTVVEEPDTPATAPAVPAIRPTIRTAMGQKLNRVA